MTVRAVDGGDLRDALGAVCHSSRWVELVVARAPIATMAELHDAADTAFDELGETDWLDAFAGHPRIGDVGELRSRFAASGTLSEREQAGIGGASDDELRELLAGNEAYEARFGFVFLIRAAGRTLPEMVAAQRERLQRDRAAELAEAATQQREIAHLRLAGLFVADDL